MNDIASASDVLTGQAEAPVEAPQTGNAPWYGEVESDLDGYIQNKGWQSAKDMADGYRNLEKLFGADRAGNTVQLPKEGDTEGWDALYGRLGRPGEASQYKIDAPEGAEDQNLQWFKDTAFAQGLSQNQAARIYEAWNDRAEAINQEVQEQQKAQVDQEAAELQKEWGQAYDGKINAARKAANQFGFDSETVDKMESVVGLKNLMGFFSKIGESLGEDSFESGDSKQSAGFGLTTAAAQAQIGELKSDPQFQKTYLDPQQPGHREAVEKMQRLMGAAYPQGGA